MSEESKARKMSYLLELPIESLGHFISFLNGSLQEFRHEITEGNHALYSSAQQLQHTGSTLCKEKNNQEVYGAWTSCKKASSGMEDKYLPHYQVVSPALASY